MVDFGLDFADHFWVSSNRNASLLTTRQHSVFQTQGEKNNGFAVLYQNMKNGQIAAREFADFLKEG